MLTGLCQFFAQIIGLLQGGGMVSYRCFLVNSTDQQLSRILCIQRFAEIFHYHDRTFKQILAPGGSDTDKGTLSAGSADILFKEIFSGPQRLAAVDDGF